MSAGGATRALAQFVAGHALNDLPPQCRGLARRGVLDAIGCGLYGHTLDHVGWATHGPAAGSQAQLWGRATRTSAAAAALANGTAVHATEMSETFIRAVVHPGNVIVPAALAVAEEHGATGGELLTAVALGYEVLIRYGFACGRDALLTQGLHTFSMLGGFGAAVACAKLRFGRDPTAIEDALGVAACLAPTTLLDSARQGVSVKDLYEGYAAQLGVLAADLVAQGAHGPSGSAEQWLRAVIRDPHPTHLTDRLGHDWRMSSGGLRIKLLPVMGLVQPTTVAVQRLLAQRPLTADQIASVRVDSTRRAVIAHESRPESVTAAKTSIPFTVAALIIHADRWREDPYLLSFFREELLHDDRVLALAQRVVVQLDEEFEHNFESAAQMKYESRVTIMPVTGEPVTGYADIWPATSRLRFDEVVPKFLACGGRSLSPSALSAVVAAVRDLERLPHLGALVEALAGPAA